MGRAARGPLRGHCVLGGHGPARDVRRRRRTRGRVHDAGGPHAAPRGLWRVRPPLLRGARLRRRGGHLPAARLGHPRHARVRRDHHHALRTRPRARHVEGRRRPRRSPRSPAVEARGILGRRRRRRPLLPVHGHVLAVGSLGDPLRRGLARDARARRLDQPLVGARRLVLEQAGARHVDAGDRDGDARGPLPARQDAHRQRHAADHAPRVGGARADRAPDDRGDVPALQGRRRRRSGGGRRSSGASFSRRCPTGTSSRTRP